MRRSAGIVRLGLVALAALATACQDRAPRAAPPPGEATPSPPPVVAPTAPAGEPLTAAGLEDRVAAVASGRFAIDQWYGLYGGGTKIGWAHIEGRAARAGEPGAVVVAVEAEVTTTSGGTRASVALASRRNYAAAAPHRLVQLVSRTRSSGGEVERWFDNGDELIVREVVDGSARPPRRRPASREDGRALIGLVGEPAWFVVGQVSHSPQLDEDREADLEHTITVIERRRQRIDGVEVEVVRLRDDKQGESSATETVLATGAITLSAAMGPGLELRREDQAHARTAVVGFDMLRDAVAIDRPLGDTASLAELRLVVDVPDGFRLRDAPNQELERLADGRLRAVLRPVPGLPVVGDEARVALAATAEIDAEAPAIRALAVELTAGATSPRVVVDRQVAWVHDHLAKDLGTNLSVASQVLGKRAGDCTEHALLFVALARAAGVPAREVSGLVYMGDAVQRFGWHAWAEVALDGRWVMVDPTFGQPVADPGHLALAVGGDESWVGILGHLTLVVDPG